MARGPTRQVPGPLCCGRTYLAAGRVDRARQEARRTLDALMPFVARGVKIVGLVDILPDVLKQQAESLGLGEGQLFQSTEEAIACLDVKASRRCTAISLRRNGLKRLRRSI